MSTKQKSISTNYIYNTILKVLNILFPMITFPYIARVLTASGVGKINFSLSVISYFILISRVGIPMYGIRECAKYRDNKKQLTKTVQEILIINLGSLIISLTLFYLILFNSNTLENYKNILLILSINIISTSIGMEWFYQAIEEYKYITLRNVLVKIVSLVLIFLLIREQNDYNLYAFILVISVSLSYFFNFFYSRTYINLFKIYSDYNFKKHVKPIFLLFAMSISISIYTNLDKVMLGILTNDEAVGYYTSANKMVKVIVALVTSLGTVLLPRMSYYIKNDLTKEVNRLINKSINFITLLAFPASVGVFMLAKPIILIFTGDGYIEAISTIRILSPVILIIGLSNLIGVQILLSHGKEKLTLISTSIGALTNFLLNLLLIPYFNHNGAAIATITAEISVTVTQIYFAYSYLKGNISFKSVFQYCIGSILIVMTCLVVNHYINNIILLTLMSILFSVFVYFSFLFIIKNKFVFEIKDRIFKKIKGDKIGG
ncbi:Membrane protein involved in the export of O-antigen and teichoic acid [Halanaerobium congolense]|uniref:Membrane protein involved in the export of O-antigen and teichoic acid n=1 Tax=Halanaerobium congolense TaxID=54121 RepID=A0A1G8R3I8_9FIRM|nr:flippase [Halanaerobium congolense]SDJ11529.1 Membrane protein involved in the export of O-antigen and teichoic acid [Halanaerobium congolense]SET66192.1 Membrane protein involved in the export of O-antigen and teichoic acid [Halanaerobium congolense]